MKTIISLTLIVLIFTLSCKKENETTTTTTPKTNQSEFLTKYKAPSQFFTVVAGQNTNITGANGTIITINQNSFYPIMSGNIKIELKEFYSRKDIILNNLQTISDNGLLATAGMIYIDVTQNGAAVNNWKIHTIMPAQITNPNIKMFYSYTQPSDSSIIWTLSNDSNYLSWDTVFTSSALGSYSGYVNSSNRFKWINCDYSLNQFPQTTVSGTITNPPQSSFAPCVYLVLDINVIAHMWPLNSNYNIFKINNIPTGLTGKIVAFTVVNGVYYLCKQPITITANINQSLTFHTVTEQELITELSSL